MIDFEKISRDDAELWLTHCWPYFGARAFYLLTSDIYMVFRTDERGRWVFV